MIMGLSAKGCIVLSFVVSVSFLILGGVLIPVFKMFTDKQLNKELPLVNGSESFDNWLSPPVPVHFNVYIFNYLNAKDIMAKEGIKPHVQEMGPYVYKETQEKFDVRIENGSISYRERKYYTFVPEKSSGLESDTLLSPNLVAMALINFLKSATTLERWAANLFFGFEPLFRNLTVSDVIWGYRDPNIDKIRNFLLKHFNVTIPEKFGIFYGKNNTDDGVYKIHSGTEDLTKIGKIESWNSKSSLPFWNSKYCNKINGSDGTLFPPHRDENSVLYIFSSDICRSVHSAYEKQYKLYNIPVYRYVPPSDLFMSGDLNPANKGFCTPHCLPSGLLNVSECQQGAPVVLSQPHFYQADPKLVIQTVKGVHPQKDKHETRIDVEPLTGVVMNAAKRLQINLYVEKVKYVAPSYHIFNQTLPVLWIDENAELTEETADKFKREVQGPIQITFGIEYGLIAFGVFLIIFSLLLIVRKVIINKNNYQTFVNEPTVESTPENDPVKIDYDAPVPEYA